jgi:succinate-acetate transporter protein
VVGLVTAGLAWYLSAAGVTNASLGRTLLPVFPWKK